MWGILNGGINFASDDEERDMIKTSKNEEKMWLKINFVVFYLLRDFFFLLLLLAQT